jgi:hypothetical protein
MIKADLEFFKQWFSDFCRSYYCDNADDQRNIALKEQHTFRVCEVMLQIAEGLSLTGNETLLAESIALFHDVGRFPQYAKYRTFRDSVSVNHGLLGAETLVENNVLRTLPDNEQELVIESVKFHNAFSVPKKERADVSMFIKLIRDADKLDIWRVFLDYFKGPAEDRASAITLGLKDTPEYSQEVLGHIFRKEIAPHLEVKTVNDFRLLQLSWVFDLNFRTSFRILSECDYISDLASYLPQTDDIRRAVTLVKEFVRQKSNY